MPFLSLLVIHDVFIDFFPTRSYFLLGVFLQLPLMQNLMFISISSHRSPFVKISHVLWLFSKARLE